MNLPHMPSVKPQEVKTLNQGKVKPDTLSSKHDNLPGNSSTVLAHKSVHRLGVLAGHSDRQCLHSPADTEKTVAHTLAA